MEIEVKEATTLVQTVYSETQILQWSTALQEIMSDCINTRIEHGFESPSGDRIPIGLMLIVSEVAEALEDFRHTKSGQEEMSDHFFEEMADIVIRVLDQSSSIPGGKEAFIEQLFQKMAKNKTREWKHGGKRI